jgi:hypothetical protein
MLVNCRLATLVTRLSTLVMLFPPVSADAGDRDRHRLQAFDRLAVTTISPGADALSWRGGASGRANGV